MNELEKLHTSLASFLFVNGERFAKKHGEWIKYQIEDNWFIEMDSWNKAITLKNGDGNYNYWTGFSGACITYYGLNWGGFSPRQDENSFKAILFRVGARLDSL